MLLLVPPPKWKVKLLLHLKVFQILLQMALPRVLAQHNWVQTQTGKSQFNKSERVLISFVSRSLLASLKILFCHPWLSRKFLYPLSASVCSSSGISLWKGWFRPTVFQTINHRDTPMDSKSLSMVPPWVCLHSHRKRQQSMCFYAH